MIIELFTTKSGRYSVFKRSVPLVMGVMLLSGCSDDMDSETSWYLGEWNISDVEFPAVSALGLDEAQEWFGSEAIYSESNFSFRGMECDEPRYEIESLTEQDFQMAYRTSFAQLGIDGGADILRVMCADTSVFPGATLIRVTEDMAYLPWDGAFFRLDRSAP